MMEIVIKCQRCGREVVAHTSQKKFCKECARQNALDRSHRQMLERVAKARESKPTHCLKCGKPIVQAKYGKRTHCEACAAEIAREKKASYRRTHQQEVRQRDFRYRELKRAKYQAKKRALKRLDMERSPDKVASTSFDARTGYTVQWRGQVCGAGGQMHHD